MIKNENYINVCGWMISELADLRLNEIFIYAIIHGFSQDGKSFYTGSLSYLMEDDEIKFYFKERQENLKAKFSLLAWASSLCS